MSLRNTKLQIGLAIIVVTILALTVQPVLAGISQQQGAVNAQGTPNDPAVLAQRVIEYTNLERAGAGLPPLKANKALASAAKGHSLAMAESDFFDHTDPNTGSTPGERARAAGYLWSTVGENIGLGYATPEDAVAGWMNSQGHRENILNPDFREIGVGFVEGPGTQASCQNPPCQFYWTQLFGAQEDVFPVVINDEAATAARPEVALTIYGEGWAQEMRLRNDNEDFTNWEPYAAKRSWTLPSTEGLHTVAVELRNAAGGVRATEDDIYLGSPQSSTNQSGSSGQASAGATPTLLTAQQSGSAATTPLQVERHIRANTLMVGEETEVAFILTGDPGLCGEEVVRSPLDIALVIDHSGSMGDSAGSGNLIKLEAAKSAAIAFLNAVELGTDQVAVISFDNSARLEQKLDIRFDTISGAISALQPGGGTNIADGLLAGWDELKSSRSRKDTGRVIVLLSDGQTSAQNEAQQIKAEGIRIVSIGLGPDVDENELRAIASSPTDYYYAPDATQLESIFLSIARSIREFPAATDVTVTHRFDVTNFEVVPDSIQPQGQLAFDRIIWRIPKLGAETQQLGYRVRARVPGNFDLSLDDKADFLECGKTKKTIDLGSGLALQVTPDPDATPTPTSGNCGDDSGRLTLIQTICGGFPWWALLPLLLFLILLALIWFANLGGWREHWTADRQCPTCCLVANILLLGYLFLLLALLLRALQPALCQPKAAIYYWEVTPDGQSQILYKPIEPDLPVREFAALNKQADCIACHSVALNADVIAAIADGSNGPVTTMSLDGTLINTPPINASYLALSPDGRQLAYAAEGKDIYILDIESGATVPLSGASDPGVVETMPAWSPDSSTIAFVRASGEVRGYALAVPSDIYTVPAAGGVATLLPGAGNGGFNYYPAYSPNGRWLAFTRHTTGSSTRADPQAEIYIVPAEGGEAKRLAANDLPTGQSLAGASNSWPTWSPDSSSLAFNSKRNGGQFDIYLTTIDPDGNSGAAQPLPGAACTDRFEHLPQWGRPPQVNLLARLLGWLPWLLGLPVLWLLKRRACRPRTYSHTVALAREVNPTGGILEKQVFHVHLTLSGDNTDCEPIRVHKPSDVILVLDISSSMGESARLGLGEQKIAGAKQAAKAFVEKLDPKQDRVGLIVFDDSAEVLHSLEADSGNLNKAIDGLGSRGGTAIHEGLRVALDEMKVMRRAGVLGTIVLLSDGGSDQGLALQQAAGIREENIRLVTVGFGADADQSLLQQLATTPADWHASASNRQLEQVFVSLAEDLQEPLAATDVVFIHQVNVGDFKLDEKSIYPRDVSIQDGTITWHVGDLIGPRTLRYNVVGKKVGENLPIDLGDTVRYKRCGSRPMELLEQAGLPVTVSEPIPPPILVKSATVPEPLPIPKRRPVWEPDAALIVGTGAFGRQVLTHLKKNLRDAGTGSIPERVQFMLLDTAQHLATGKPLQFAGVSLDDADVIVLDENLRPVIEAMLRENASHAELRPWFPAESYAGGATQTHTLAEGTHGARPIARAGLVRRVSGKATSQGVDLRSRLKEALQAVNHPPQGVRVLLVGSLSEGMGATLWDLAYLVQELARQHLGESTPVAIEGYFDIQTRQGLYETIEDAELNAFTALRELTWFQLNSGFPIRFDYGNSDLNDRLRPLSRRLVDDLYLFIDNLEGPTPSTVASLADLITLRLDLKTRRDWDAKWYEARRTEVQQLEAKNREVFFGTGGSYALRLPAYDLIEMVKARWTREVIQSFLMGSLRENLAFSAQFVTDPGLPQKPEALVLGFLLGFKLGDHLYDVKAQAPGEVQSLGQVLQGKVDEAAKQSADGDADAVHRYMMSTLRFFLTGTEQANADQQRAGKIGYVSEFLEALKLTCEGELRQRIAKAPVPDGTRQTWEETRQIVLKEVQEAINHVNGLKHYLGAVYGALTERQSALSQWRKEMNALTSRCYVWEELVDPTGARFDSPRKLEDVWYEQAYQIARPESFAPYLVWDIAADGNVDLRLLLTKSEAADSAQMSAEDFAEHFLRFADDRLRTLWDSANLDSVAEQALVLLAERLQHQNGGRNQVDIRQLVGEIQVAARPRSDQQQSFTAGQRVVRHALASSSQATTLQGLSSEFPEASSAESGIGYLDWPRLPLSDRLSWQLVQTQDGLTPGALARYERIAAEAASEDKHRAVFAWEAMAKQDRERYGEMLLHPVVAATLIDEKRAFLYALAFASDWVVQSGQWHVRPTPTDQPIISWSPTNAWDGNVYGLLHFVFRATDSQVSDLTDKLSANATNLHQKWLGIAQTEPALLRKRGDADDLYSLRLLARYAVRIQIGKSRSQSGS